MLHVTCATNGLHRVAKQVRSHFSTVDKLIANVKQLQVCYNFFKNELPGVNLPPESIITRWWTWISAAAYYYEKLHSIHHIIE
ncbi:Uncharacterized protein FWK35_00016983 [Aphis craccivora]|uniref:Uncharacterized protein n=1 Tax=Aphis craccivora TaxID=307492 RepID=A0A6G0XWK6_APHCR|nr:Uncharacterized protein FWK35_00016983 [Aphis craccivora]